MAAYFLLLFGGVGFIQDKRFFSSAHIAGGAIIAVSLLLFAGSLVLGVWDGVKKGFGFLQFFGRFIAMLYIMEIYDIIFFDRVLLCHSNFFPHFCPEVKGVVGPHMFSYNKKQHIIHFIVYIPVCAVIAWICTLF